MDSRAAQSHITKVIIAATFVLWPTVASHLITEINRSTLPTILDLLPGVFAGIIATSLKSPYLKLYTFVWIAWYFIGSINTLTSSIILGGYYSYMDLGEATQIYLFGCCYYFIGLWISEAIFKNGRIDRYGIESSSQTIKGTAAVLILLFPIAWAISLVLSVGYIPIFSGLNIVDDIYELSYGPLYAYGIAIVISTLFAAQLAMHSTRPILKASYWTASFLFLSISFLDGKRAIAMIAIAGIIGISFKHYKDRTWTRILPTLATAMLATYVIILLLRVGDSSVLQSDVYRKYMIIGVEFRDFVYTVNHFRPFEIDNYSWATSTLASMGNGWLLSLVGLDKSELTSLDSARAWASIWNTKFGIRTGIVSELWFAYGHFYSVILVILGFINGKVAFQLSASKTSFKTIAYGCLYGLFLLLVTSQSTFTFGIIPVLAYALIAIKIAGLLRMQNDRHPRIVD